MQAPPDAVPLIFGLHCTCVFSYLSKPLKCMIAHRRVRVGWMLDALNLNPLETSPSKQQSHTFRMRKSLDIMYSTEK